MDPGIPPSENNLRTNSPEVQVASEQNLCIEIIGVALQTSVRRFKRCFQKKLLLTTLNELPRTIVFGVITPKIYNYLMQLFTSLTFRKYQQDCTIS